LTKRSIRNTMAGMPHAAVDGIEIYHETIGDPADPTLLLIMGLGTQMIGWDPEFCQALADKGFHVVRYDNRDVGLSTHLDEPVDIFALIGALGSGEQLVVPYFLTDMARDAVGLLDHLGVARAHMVGVSMGGMIAQTLAIEHPDRVATLTSIMSTTGDPDVGAPTAEALQAIMAPPATTRDEAADTYVMHAHVWGSPAFIDEERLRAISGAAYDRANDPMGGTRQLAAVLASGSRSDRLGAVSTPTLVIHGTEDKLIQPSGGERTAEVVPDAKLLMIEGMGHDLPPALWPRLVEAITTHAAEHEGT
jgi:pimeloyl-ACP methyl ester carboxylesterase